MDTELTLVLRLAGPLQSWGSTSRHNQRYTSDRPTKSGVLGLLAAASGRRRGDPIEDLLALRMGVRVDQAGTVLRDYHTVSDFRGRPLLSASVNRAGVQQSTSPKKSTHLTERYYLQDAVFIAAVSGNNDLLAALAESVVRPAFLLSLGRRSCVPTLPILVPGGGPHGLWAMQLERALEEVPWQAGPAERKRRTGDRVRLPVTTDDESGDGLESDVPESFGWGRGPMLSRPVRPGWVELPSGNQSQDRASGHDPFELLGGAQ